MAERGRSDSQRPTVLAVISKLLPTAHVGDP